MGTVEIIFKRGEIYIWTTRSGARIPCRVARPTKRKIEIECLDLFGNFSRWFWVMPETLSAATAKEKQEILDRPQSDMFA